jgi:hypothetical protein
MSHLDNLPRHSLNEEIEAEIEAADAPNEPLNQITKQVCADILVIEENVSPVVIENELVPAITVEAEALARLGKQVRTTDRCSVRYIRRIALDHRQR